MKRSKLYFKFLRAILIFIFTFHILHFNCYAQEIPSSQKISLDIKGMDVVDVLKMLSQRADLNIIVGKNVTGKVSLFLKDVDIWDAFEIILLANDLAYEKKADIINVMTSRDYELVHGRKFSDKKEVLILSLKYAKAADLGRVLTQVKSDIGRVITDESSNTIIILDLPERLRMIEAMVKGLDLPVETKVFELNYASVDKIIPKIQELLTKGVGSVRIDERTNKVVITDFPGKIEEIKSILKAFDERTPQVLIDAQIIEIKPSDEFRMGVDWDWWLRKNFRVTSPLLAETPHKLIMGTTDVSEPGQYKAILDLLRRIGETKILSSPRIMALNNQEAKILVGEKEPYIQETTQITAEGKPIVSGTVTFIDVGLKLYVTPTINRENFVTMKIKPEVSSATDKTLTSGDREYVVPKVITSEAETSITIKDGVTIIIGGLRKDRREKVVEKIPILGDIPLAGFFFRSTKDKLEKTELVILLTPHILTGEKSIVDFSELKPTEGAIVKMEKGRIITERVFAPEKPKLKEVELTPTQYYCLIHDKIKECAKQKLPRDLKGEVEFLFSLLSTGQIFGKPKILKITDENLIPLVLQILEESSPFPPFPKSIEKEKEDFHLIISYE